MQTTLAAVSLIKTFEGFKPDAYIDPLGIPTIGYGITRYSDGEGVQIGDTVGHDEAEKDLFTHVRSEVEPTLDKLFGSLDLQPNQRDALASFIYNLGPDMRSKYPTLHRLVHEGASDERIAAQLVRYRNEGSRAEKGLYRRRVAEALMWAGKSWERAKTIELEDDVLDILNEAKAEDELFEEPAKYEDLAPAQKTEYLNDSELARLRGEPVPPVPKPLKVASRAVTVEVADVPYISNPAPKVKKMEESQRGKGFAKTQTATEVGALGVAGTAATAVGAMEPAVKFVDKYPKETIAYVFFALLVASVVYYYYGKWQRQKGEDEAEDLLS